MTQNYDLSDLGAAQSHDLSDLGATQAMGTQSGNSAQQPQSFADNLANSPGIQGILGAGDAARGTLADVANAIPGVNIPNPKFGSGLSYNIGNFLGNAGTFMAGGEILDTLRAGLEAVPYVGSVMQYLGGSGVAGGLRRAIGAGTYGAAASPDNRTGGGEMGAGLSVASDFLPPSARVATQAAQAFRPEQYADQLLQTLGGGKTIEENQQALAQNIQGAYENQKDAGSALYKPIFDSVGNSSIYDSVRNPAPNNFQNVDQITEHMNDVTGKNFDDEDDVKDYLNSKYNANLDSNKDLLNYFNSAPNVGGSRAGSQYLNMNPGDIVSHDPDLQDLHNKFIQNPTFDNAHILQSQLGSAERQIGKNTNPSVYDSGVQKQYIRARGALRSDMSSFLDSSNPGMANQYNAAASNWEQNVVPYLENPQIAKIAQGDITNPDNISTIFGSPENNTKKVVSDLGQSGINQILYSQLGQQVGKGADKLYSAIPNLSSKSVGFGSYITPDMQNQFDSLNSKISYRNNLQRGAGALAGLGASHSSYEGALTAAGLGMAASPYVMKALQKVLPIGKGANGLSGLAQYGYSPASQAVIGNLAKGNQ
jgi:hypothetical protein